MNFRIVVTVLLAVCSMPCLSQTFATADPSRIALFPQQNELRNTLNVSGMWQFKKDSLEVGERENWQNGLTDARAIAVPGSWNEQFTDSRDYLGMVWYEKETYVPSAWKGSGHERSGHERSGHERPGHDRPGHDRPGHDRPGHDRPGHDRPGHDRPGHDRPGHDRPGHDRPGRDSQRIFIRVGSATYAAKLWINGRLVGKHEGGNVPFAFEISSFVKWGETNRISIQIENNLKPTRVPTGNVVGSPFQSFPKANYDFFPFAGLHRDVWLYTTPTVASIKDITVKTDFTNTTGSVDVTVTIEGKATQANVVISGSEKKYEASIRLAGNSGNATISIPDVRLWSPEDPYLYTVDVTIGDGKTTLDHYRLETGVRTISTNSNQLLLNGKPIFLKGFGKHEDFPIFGRGAANPVIVKDFALMKWTGANSLRTSHYPYDEEFMRMADREGFLVIDEIPAVGLYFHGDTTELAQRQAMCKQYINELITRDKNHPSVIMWCVANEPFPANVSVTGGAAGREATPQSIVAFKELFDLVRQKDNTRLAVLVGVMGGPAEWVGMSDVLCINRYYGWYTHAGDMAGATKLLAMEIDGLHKKFNKPVIITEFGADTYPGMHTDEPEMFTEEFQTNFIKAYLDVAASRDFVAGMHVWAFSDFKTGQGIIRFGGVNYKGVFTRDRKPKAAAFYLRSRWGGK